MFFCNAVSNERLIRTFLTFPLYAPLNEHALFDPLFAWCSLVWRSKLVWPHSPSAQQNSTCVAASAVQPSSSELAGGATLSDVKLIKLGTTIFAPFFFNR